LIMTFCIHLLFMGDDAGQAVLILDRLTAIDTNKIPQDPLR